MLLSMTGHGESVVRVESTTVIAEVRAVNNRYFKLNFRASEGFGSLEPRVENIARESIRRGTLYVTLRIAREAQPGDFRIHAPALLAYRRQLAELAERPVECVPVEHLLALPGVVDESRLSGADPGDVWPVAEQAVRAALKGLHAMRVEEGKAMIGELRSVRAAIGEQLRRVHERAPLVTENYRTRLLERLERLLAEFPVSVSASDVVREVGLFADRSDISEEVVRLRSHLDQFDTLLEDSESGGRKLEFLVQEMFREANTVGSKSNDAEIARGAIEIKTHLERIRELIQNVE